MVQIAYEEHNWFQLASNAIMHDFFIDDLLTRSDLLSKELLNYLIKMVNYKITIL